MSLSDSMQHPKMFFLFLFAVLVDLTLAANTTPIIIVGAGAAGLGAAARLQSYGFTNVQIFEALNRTGGRVYSQVLGKSFRR